MSKSKSTPKSTNLPSISDLLNAQTARIPWSELQRHFARGVLVVVASNEDLLEVAQLLVDDDSRAIAELAKGEKVRRALDDDARIWTESQPDFWAVVVAPWVLVQEVR